MSTASTSTAPTGGTPLHLASDLAARVRAAALREAARRFREREAQQLESQAALPAPDDGPSGGSKSFADTTAQTSMAVDDEELSVDAEERHTKLLNALRDEKARNDAEWEIVQRELTKLGKRVSGASDAQDAAMKRSIRDKEIQLAQIEYHIQRMDEKVADLGPNTSALVRDVKARGNLSDVILQLQDVLIDAEADVARARQSLQSEKQLLSDLTLIEQGMQMRQRQLERKSTQLTEEEVIEQLKTKLRTEEEQLGELLNALIRTSNDLFSDDDARLRVQLRSLLDALMNQAWDAPADPYITIDKHPKSLASFLVRAHVAQEHPRDSRRLCLVPFQKGVR
ncbi:hypothetical protein K437DRAFT_251249 [Tilletiaria anomala UBC 951]|uniref:Uncharacterized protein n=1 Tax=Tilletiaria anomala (strain ATCC 24038 / CBS 436.72 / UBC 951) TaxID=1037660 RepID=A0A066VIV3_TILAU|nr:uncharacterized protein K437DRAFT_251249 [Tilletiaria anomala UBC 951]KDN38515.1 hypothetical protein K437DRAFT_251249 [Tilletiaria anomala UBC 951]